jgi:hypothetical protein
MTVICCHICRADPFGRWKHPPAMVFIDGRQSTDASQYRCRDHLSPKREEQIKMREKALGLPPGGLR